MRYLLTAIGVMVGISMCSTIYAAETKEKIDSLSMQIKESRMQVKALRAQDRVNKAVDKFCATQDSIQYRICVNGAFEEVGKSNSPGKR